jgi:hypothetical protein
VLTTIGWVELDEEGRHELGGGVKGWYFNHLHLRVVGSGSGTLHP